MCQTLASEYTHSPDPALRGFPSTGEGDTGQMPIIKVTTGTRGQVWFGNQNIRPPFPDLPSTFAGSITLRPQTLVWEKESLIFYNSTQCLFSGLILTENFNFGVSIFFFTCPGFVPQSQLLIQGTGNTWTPSALSSWVPTGTPILSVPVVPMEPGISHLGVHGFAGLLVIASLLPKGSASFTCHTVRKLFVYNGIVIWCGGRGFSFLEMYVLAGVRAFQCALGPTCLRIIRC